MEKLLGEITSAIMNRWSTAEAIPGKVTPSTSSDLIREFVINEELPWLISVENRAGRGYAVICSRTESSEKLQQYKNEKYPNPFHQGPEKDVFLEYYIEKDFFSDGYKTHFYKNRQINSVIWSIDNLVKNLEFDFSEYEKQYA
ncbi:hypothetical protein [Dyadobacter psychrotolerans]|uniref:Uncharacterized protein n=1 Tax=Dyadobacter psychrotolerans TaxID=2541721 RepID=A0A4R5DQS6_9BACT|nr:hypothetical protein [Dyadobacter psychrotolerans]TDE14614.1 hypothetical protein E0F88_15590 [Dyadobacter psychrotolerans]